MVTLAADATPGTLAFSTVSTCNGSAGTPTSSYFAKADPTTRGVTGVRYFATDGRGRIVYDDSTTVLNPISIAIIIQ